jgi:hypothetical protein
MSTTYVVVLALLTGIHAATWGAYKDSPFEGFKPVSFARTIVLALVAAAGLALLTELETTMAPLVFVGLIYAVERLATELWKSFLREDDQEAYAIPMRIAILGRTVDGRLSRYLMGIGVLVAVVVMALAAAALQPAGGGSLPLLVLVGGIGGWLTAVGGAWKDAPVEGFSGWKFLRSPVVATAWTIMLLPFTQDWVALTFAAAGLSVLSIETYKTFFTGGRPPGKFDGKPIRPGVEVQRHWCQLLHSGVYVCLASIAGLMALFDVVDRPSPGAVSLVVLSLVAVTISVRVALSHPGTAPVVRRNVVEDAVVS